jgi:hypothetical protein
LVLPVLSFDITGSESPALTVSREYTQLAGGAAKVMEGCAVIQAQSEKRSQATIFLVAIPRDPAI